MPTFGKKNSAAQADLRTPTTPRSDNHGPEILSEAFVGLTFKCVAAAIGAFALQLIPFVGIVTMMLLAPFWIGLITHYYFLSVLKMAMRREISRILLILPVTFYCTGAALGLYGDLVAWQLRSADQWVQIDGLLPRQSWPLVFSRLPGDLKDPRGAFKPEKYEFTLTIFDGPNPTLAYSLRNEPCAQDKITQIRFADRCYVSDQRNRPSKYVLIDNAQKKPDYEQPMPHLWGALTTRAIEIIFVDGDVQQRIGQLVHGTVYKNYYFFFPFAGCGLNSSVPKWECAWGFRVPPLRTEGMGFSFNKPEAAEMLMSALSRLHEQPNWP